MKSRIAYIILFLTAFIFPSVAQDSYVEYEYVDGTKETDIISFDRMECKYSLDKGKSYIISNIFIHGVFEPKKGDPYFSCLWISFKNGEPSNAIGPRSYTSMGNYYTLFQYDLCSGKTVANNGITTVLFKSKDTNPRISRHNGKLIKSISGCISYSKFKINPSLNYGLIENLKPFYLDSTLLSGNCYSSYLKFVSPSYDEKAKKINLNDLSLERVKVINNLKRMGYTLTSPKGVFPLTYQNQDGNTILVYETYIVVVAKD